MDNINSDQIKELNEAIRALVETFSDLSISMKGASQEAKDASEVASEAAKEAISAEKAAQAFGEKAAGMFGIVKSEGSMFGLIEDLAKVATGAGDAGSSMGTATKAFTGMFTKANALATAFSYLTEAIMMMVGATVSMALETDKALTSFNKSTGAAGKYNDMMLSLEAQHRSNQISMEDLSGTFEALSQNFGAFNHMAFENQRALAENTAILGELGVSYETTASNLNVLITGMGMSADAANRVQNEMFYLAQQIGMSPNSMSAAFSEAMPKLAAFGKSAPEIFKKLQVNAQRAGMSMNDILSITEKFDRFDTAAESVGKLNAILGGPYMSVTKMIKTTDPTDRMRILSQATREAGKSFDSMAYYERKALAAAMGLEDVSQLALVMNNRFDLLAPATEKSAAELEALAEQTAQFNEVGDVISSTLKQIIANFGPMIKGIKSVVGGIGTLIATFPILKLGIAGLAAAFVAAAIVIMASMTSTGIGGIIVGVGLIITALIAGAGAIYSFLGSWNELTAQLSGSMGLWGALMGVLKVFLMLNAPILGVVWAIAQVFTHWEEIMNFIYEAIDPLMPKIKELSQRFHDLFASSSSATQSFDLWGTVLQAVSYMISSAVQQYIYLAEGILYVAETVRRMWDEFAIFRYGLYTIAAVVGVVVAALVLLATWPMLVGIAISWLLEKLGILRPLLMVVGAAIATVVLSLLAVPIAIVAAVGSIIYLWKWLYDLIDSYFGVTDAITSFVSEMMAMHQRITAHILPLFQRLIAATLKFQKSVALKAAVVAFQLLKSAALAAYSPVAAIASIFTTIYSAISSATDALADFKEEVSGILSEMPAAFSTVISPVGSLGSTIASSGQSKADSKVAANAKLAASVNKLTASLDKNGPQQVEVVVGTNSKFLTHTQKSINKVAQGKNVYSNSSTV